MMHKTICQHIRYLDEMKLRPKWPKLTQREIESLNINLTSQKLTLGIKDLLMKKSPDPYGFHDEIHKLCKGPILQILHKLFQKNREKDTLQLFL